MVAIRGIAVFLIVIAHTGRSHAFTSNGFARTRTLCSKSQTFLRTEAVNMVTALDSSLFSLSMGSSDSVFNQNLLPIVGATIAVFGGAVFVIMSKSKSPPESMVPTASKTVQSSDIKFDVSVPYDAAARLAYCELKGLNVETAVYDESAFQKFKDAYETTTVSNVIVKKMERELQTAQAIAIAKSNELTSML